MILETGLREKDPSAKVFCLDLPGFGTEAHQHSPRSVSGIVENLRERWMKLKRAQSAENQDWSLFAVSLGGMVSLQWCSDHPYDFKKLVLTNSSLSGLNPIHQRLRPTNYPTIISLLMSSDVAAREKKILKMTTNLKPDALEMRAKIHTDFALPVRKSDAISQIYAGSRFKAPKKVITPILVLNSLGDRLVNPICSESIAKRYGAPLISHPTGNHDLPTDDPHWIVEQVRNWEQN